MVAARVSFLSLEFPTIHRLLGEFPQSDFIPIRLDSGTTARWARRGMQLTSHVQKLSARSCFGQYS